MQQQDLLLKLMLLQQQQGRAWETCWVLSCASLAGVTLVMVTGQQHSAFWRLMLLPMHTLRAWTSLLCASCQWSHKDFTVDALLIP
jgi:hypothetical protein